ncbi:MAG TPA: beta-eliminating lyase-related protein [Bacteroidales bacterium]|nr:beta-eliminating lyase-related protein [Bacteroidales bacterium]
MSEVIKRGFASDNNSGVHPKVMLELSNVNRGHVVGYGDDQYTDQAKKLLQDHLGKDAEVFFVFNGTAANIMGLSAITRSWNAILSAYTAHIEQDECGAPEKNIGCKVLTVDTPDGKLKPELLAKHMHGFGFEHHSQPRVISISQPTEMGTVYSVNEIKAIADFAHSHDMLLHMDGARLANAAVSLSLPFKAFTTDAGVDVLSFGGTKNGMMYGEAVVFLRPGISDGFKYIRKQSMQLASKMRFISAQYIAYLRDEVWKECATHSNKLAKKLENSLRGVEGIRITQSVDANAIFVIMPRKIAQELNKEYFFYPWDEAADEYRLMTSWDTTEEDIETFVALLSRMLTKR